jgi:hypothetical protein
MNSILSEDWIEKLDRLALGLEPIDAARGTRMPHPFQVVFDETARGLPRPDIHRHESCLFVLLYDAKLPTPPTRVKLRFVEIQRVRVAPFLDVPRRFVPRLISFPIRSVADAELQKFSDRTRRPLLFPGAAYEVPAGATGLRGRVSRNGQPVRWARVSATQQGNGVVVGRAHGDDRGEFLLLVQPDASGIGDLPISIPITVSVSCRDIPPPLPSLVQRESDPFWDLPEEVAPDPLPGNPLNDPVATGETPPAGFTAPVATDMDLVLGEIQSAPAVFVIT